MPLELQPMQESDLDAAIDVMWEAFRDDIMGMMYPDGFSKADHDHYKTSILKKWRKNPDTIKRMKVVDTDLPDDDPYLKIVGTAEWNLFLQRSQEEMDAEERESEHESEKEGHSDGMDVAFTEYFIGQTEKCKKEILGGQPHVLLHILATHPQHHRRGAGAMHLKWGFAMADDLGLPVYLEASPIGRPLYARNGFETMGWMPVDGKKLGKKKDLPHALMLRPAKTQTKPAE